MNIKKSGYIERFKLKLIIAFEMVDIRPISFYLGLKIKRNRAKKILKLLQPAYINKVLTKYHFNKATLCNIPMKKTILLSNKSSKASQAKRE